jgi:hypothetical protein
VVCTDAFCCSDQCRTDLAGLGKGYRTGDFGDCIHCHPDANWYADGYSYLDSKRYSPAHIYAQFYANAISYFHPDSHPNTDVHVYVYKYSYRYLHSNPHSYAYASSYAHAYSHANSPASGLD